MARIGLIEPQNARTEVKHIYEHRLGGRPGNVHKAMAHNPQALTPFLAFYQAVGKSLDRRLWELIYLRVSFINGCEYCTQHHVVSSKKVGVTAEDVTAVRTGQYSHFSKAEDAAIFYAEQLTQAPGEVEAYAISRLKSHFTEEQIVDIHLLVGLANLTNRFTSPLGLELEFEAVEV